MARYIDADALKLDIDLSKGASVLDMAISVIKAVKDAPTADVVPKSEVDEIIANQRQRLNEHKMQIVTLQDKLEQVEVEVAREIFAEIDKRFEALLMFHPGNGELEDAKSFVDFHWKYIKKSIMHDYDAELKKKYTGDQT